MQIEGTAPVTRTTKRCPRCAATKPLSAFYRRRDDRPTSYCRDCQRIASRASYDRRRQNPEALERMRATDRRRKRQARALAARGGAC